MKNTSSYTLHFLLIVLFSSLSLSVVAQSDQVNMVSTTLMGTAPGQQKENAPEDTQLARKNEEIRMLRLEVIEMQSKMEQLQLCMLEEMHGSRSKRNARLYQQSYNSYKEKTALRYYLPKSVEKATLTLLTEKGEVIKSFTLSQPGEGKVIIEGGALSAGSYRYELIVNGKKKDSKKMLLTKE